MAILVVSGCLGAPARPATSATPTLADGGERSTPVDGGPSPTRHPSLESVLVGLVDAEDRTAFAREQGLQLQDGKVLVVVELVEGRSLPDGFEVDVTARHDELVQAYVAVDELSALARHRNVSFVRTPREPIEHDTSIQ